MKPRNISNFTPEVPSLTVYLTTLAELKPAAMRGKWYQHMNEQKSELCTI
jgi:hypothetical protein